MAWESFKMMLCPFCENGRVKVRHVPALKKETLAGGSAVSKKQLLIILKNRSEDQEGLNFLIVTGSAFLTNLKYRPTPKPR